MFSTNKLSNKRLELLLHFMLWIPSIAVPLVLMPMKDGARPDQYLALPKLLFTVMQISVFYTMVYYLYPRFFLRQKIKTYIFSIIGLCALIAGISISVGHLSGQDDYTALWASFGIKFLIGMAVMATGTSFMLIVYVVKEQRLQQENLKTELVFLRSQVSPHFMFNTLNSMVSLARKKSDQLEPALIELSNLMHYMLYESDEEKVSISREIDYIQSYIDLQSLRFGQQVRISFKANKPPDDFPIEPMLLIPLIENAFKHGIGMIFDPEITINLEVRKETVLLNVRNKFNHQTVETKDKTSGIGLTNLDRRLNLLYPGKHSLNISANGNYFNASLKITFHDKVFSC